MNKQQIITNIEAIRLESKALREKAERLEALLPGMEYALKLLDDKKSAKTRGRGAARKQESSFDMATPMDDDVNGKLSILANANIKRLTCSGKTRQILEFLRDSGKGMQVDAMQQHMPDSSEGAIRSLLTSLKKRQLIHKFPKRGYMITQVGLELLKQTGTVTASLPTQKVDATAVRELEIAS